MLMGHLPIILSQTLLPHSACSDEQLKMEKPRDWGASTEESGADSTLEVRLRTDALNIIGEDALIPLQVWVKYLQIWWPGFDISFPIDSQVTLGDLPFSVSRLQVSALSTWRDNQCTNAVETRMHLWIPHIQPECAGFYRHLGWLKHHFYQIQKSMAWELTVWICMDLYLQGQISDFRYSRQ